MNALLLPAGLSRLSLGALAFAFVGYFSANSSLPLALLLVIGGNLLVGFAGMALPVVVNGDKFCGSDSRHIEQKKQLQQLRNKHCQVSILMSRRRAELRTVFLQFRFVLCHTHPPLGS